jgi:hypothetical protein
MMAKLDEASKAPKTALQMFLMISAGFAAVIGFAAKITSALAAVSSALYCVALVAVYVGGKQL